MRTVEILVQVVILFLFTGYLNAQSYSSDPEKFLKDVEKDLTRTNRSEGKAIMKEIEPIFLEQFNTAEQNLVIEKANHFVDDLRFRYFPDLADYLYGLINISKKEDRKAQFDQWHEFIGKMDGDRRKKRALTNFITGSRYFFQNQTVYRNRSGSLVWQSREPGKMIFEDEPFLEFENTDLVCRAKGDSIELFNTSGTFSFSENLWRGEGGKVTWERVNFAVDEVWADLRNYEIDMTRSEYEADSVVFSNSFYFDKPLIGGLQDKIFPQPDKSRLSYPRFNSYSTRLPIQNIIKNVDYDGGFAQQAGKFLGRGSADEPATLIISRENKPFMLVEAGSFLIKLNKEEEPDLEGLSRRERKKLEKTATAEKSRIVSQNARITMLLGEDTISHPGLKFTLLTDDRILRLERDDKGMSSTPFFNDFHEVEMEFNLLEWEIDKPRMIFTALTGEKRARFTSSRFFKERMFDQLSGGASLRLPLVDIRKCTKKHGTQEIDLYQMCDCMGLSPDQVEPMMLRYTIRGYVDYNSETQTIKVFDKVHHHVLSKSKLTDYDVININSGLPANSPQPNASLNLLNFDMTVYGVRGILLSDSHRVQIIPEEGKIILKKNRDMDFSGLISAGKAEFYGKEFKFLYDDFKFEMPVVDSLQLWADSPKRDKRGNLLEARVRTVIEDLRGEMRIDQPGNKSGLKSLSQYPIFKSEKESYTYYDQNKVLGGVYDRDKFYFQLEPFELDSLDKFENKKIRFSGTFVSAGIFSDLEEELVLQPDYSLGFRRTTERGGLEAYGGKGTFTNNLSLSNKGLRGEGHIDYITSRAVSKEFFFFPDSVRGVTQKFNVEEQKAPVEYANIDADSTDLTWLPYRDQLMAKTFENRRPMSMYGGRSQHRGSIKYGPNDLRGAGVSRFSGANLMSNDMHFRLIELEADTSDFELEGDMFGDVNFSSENLHALVNFQDNVGEFVSNTGRSLTKFGQILYQAYLDRFTWLMESDEFEYSAEGGTAQGGADEVQVEGAEFVSIHPKQDSLRFFAKAALYNAREVVIEAKEVDFILVADASVKPGDGKVVVEKDAKMNTLDSARITANTKTEFHNIENASVNITGRWTYSGSGTYWYEDLNENRQEIYFNLIKANENRETVASGKISRDEEFTLSPQFNFTGDVSLEASERNLTFDGLTMINHGCSNLPQQWIKFQSQIDPNDIYIELPEVVLNENNNPVATGMIFPTDTGNVYGTYLSSPFSDKDIEVLPSRGYLTFDYNTMEYRIASFDKLNERALPGNYTALNTQSCLLDGDGKMEMTYETGRMDISPVGNYSFNTVDKSLNLHFLLSLDFLFDDKLLEIIQKEISSDERAKPVNIDNEFYTLGMRNILGVEATDEMLGRMKLGRRVRLPDELKIPFFFNDVQMKFNEEEQAYVSDGPLGIGNMGDEIMNLYTKGGISFENKRRGTDVMLYINTGKNFYVFNYRASSGIMQVFTENDEFVERLRDIKTKDRRIKGDKENKQFIYQMGSRRLKSSAMRRFEDLD